MWVRGGVVSKLRSLNKGIIGIHCIAHRLALCLADAAKQCPEVQNYQLVLKSIFSYFSNSAVRSNKLREVQELLEEPILRYTEPHSVRWLSVYSAVDVVFRTLDSLHVVLENEAVQSRNGQSKYLMKSVSEYTFVALTHIMRDVLEPLARLSKFFQSENLNISVVTNMIDAVKAELKGLQVKCGPSETKFFSDLNGNKFRNFKLADPGNQQRKRHDNLKSQFIGHVLTELEYRFPVETLEIFSKFSVLDPKAINKQDINFGIEEVTILLKNIDSDHDEDMYLSEYSLYKKVVTTNSYYLTCTFPQFCTFFLQHHEATFPIISFLLKIALVCPLSSVACERGFSTQNRIKSKFRSRLSNDMLHCLMSISELGPPELPESVLMRSCILWEGMKNRYLNRKK